MTARIIQIEGHRMAFLHGGLFRAGDLERWEATGRRLQAVTPTVSLELFDLRNDPCKHRLGRAAKAARYAASICDQPLRTEAIALAEELEQRAF